MWDGIIALIKIVRNIYYFSNWYYLWGIFGYYIKLLSIYNTKKIKSNAFKVIYFRILFLIT